MSVTSERVGAGGTVSIVSIDNPSMRNALDNPTRQALLAELNRIQADRSVGTIVLTGAGGQFCAGGELRSMPTEAGAIATRLGEMHAILRAIVTGPKPVIAVVEGSAFGSGFALAAACDYVVAGPTARFGCTFARVGLAPDTGLIWALTRRVGARRARAIVATSEVLDSMAAHGIGLADELMNDGPGSVDAMRVAATRVAKAWAGGGAALAVAGARQLFNAAHEDLDTFLERELAVQTSLLASADFAEGRSAFFEKRTPTFTGD